MPVLGQRVTLVWPDERPPGDAMTRGWDDVSSAYATTFAPLCAGAFPALELELTDWAARGAAGSAAKPGLTGGAVLDVGIGTGEWAARLLCAGARVTGVDPDPGMVRLTAETAPVASLAVAGLPDLPYSDGAFDVVTANFVVNHVPDPRAGVRELARVTRVGGIVACTIWPTGATLQSQLWSRVVQEVGALVPPGATLPPERDFPRTSAGLADLLAGAGLADVRARTTEWDFRSDPDVIWRGASAGIGGMGAVLLAQDEPTRSRMREAYLRLIDEHVRDGELILPTRAVLATGTRPRHWAANTPSVG